MRLIDADVLYEALKNQIYTIQSMEWQEDRDDKMFMLGYNSAIGQIKRMIEKQPTVDPVKHGHWEQVHDSLYDDNHYRCSVCGQDWLTIEGSPYYNNMYYCPHCGAKMDEVSE